MKNIKITSAFFVLGFSLALLFAFYFLPTPSSIAKAKQVAPPEKESYATTKASDLFLVVWKEGGKVEGIYTKAESAEVFIKQTQNQDIYEIRVLANRVLANRVRPSSKTNSFAEPSSGLEDK